MLNVSVTDSPDVVKCLTSVVHLCFPDNARDLVSRVDGRSAASPLALISVIQRLQHFVAGGGTSDHRQDCSQGGKLSVLHLQPNSITLAGSELAPNRFRASSELVRSWFGACSGPALNQLV